MRKHIFYNTVNFQPVTFRILFFRGIQTLQMRLSRKACFWWTQLLRPFCRAADDFISPFCFCFVCSDDDLEEETAFAQKESPYFGGDGPSAPKVKRDRSRANRKPRATKRKASAQSTTKAKRSRAASTASRKGSSNSSGNNSGASSSGWLSTTSGPGGVVTSRPGLAQFKFGGKKGGGGGGGGGLGLMPDPKLRTPRSFLSTGGGQFIG